MKVLISGGGVAGPALAYWLHRYGMDVTIVEKAPGLRPGGQAVDIRGAARDVVERMGLMPQVRAAAVDERGIAMIDRTGRRVAAMAADMFGGEGIVAEIEISRGDLAQVLHDATRDVVEHRFGDRITALVQDDDGVDVTFASGGTERFDIVVGADGVHSGVRALAFGPERDFVHHLGGYTAYFTVTDPGDLDHWFLMYNEAGGRVAGIRPEHGGTAKAMLTFTSPELPPVRDRREQEALLIAHLGGMGWRVPEFLAQMPAAGDFYFDSISRVTVDDWSRGRVVLLGDAGYCGSPLAGLGTSMALVGAFVLAGELATAGGDHRAAFAAYQREMKDYATDGLKLPPGGIDGFAPQSRLMLRMRLASMRMVTRWPMKAMMAKQFSKADAIVLKDYRAADRQPAGTGDVSSAGSGSACS